MYPVLLALALLAGASASPAWKRDASCGIKGYDHGTQAYSYKASSQLGTFEACSARCAAASSKCKSFAFSSGGCLLYKVSVASNVAQDSSSPYTFYDSTCVSGPASSHPVVTKSIRSSTKPTKRSSTKSSPPSSRPSSSNLPQVKCDVVGYDKGNPDAFYYSRKTQDATLAGCATLCRSESGCKSFAFGSGECLLYKATVNQNVDLDGSSPYHFYDIGCVTAIPTATPTPSKTRSSRSSEVSLSASSRTRTNRSSQSTLATTSSPSKTASRTVTRSSTSSTVHPSSSSNTKTTSSSVTTQVSSTVATGSTLSGSVSSASACWTALGSSIPSPAPNNLIQNNFQNGFWDQWSVRAFGGLVVSNDCPGYNGQPSGKIVCSPQTQVESRADLVYNGYTLQPGLQYRVSVRVNFDAPSSCIFAFQSTIGPYILLDQGSGNAGAGIPVNQWKVLTGTFIATADQPNLAFYTSCSMVDSVTLHITDLVVSTVSNVVYKTGMTPTGPELLTNSDFSNGETDYVIGPSEGVTYNISSGGFLGTAALVTDFPAYNNASELAGQVLVIDHPGVNVVKDAVYEASFDFNSNNKLATYACLAVMGVNSGPYELNLFGAYSDSLPPSPLQRLSGIFASPVDGATPRVIIFCSGYSLPAQRFYVDNYSVHKIS